MLDQIGYGDAKARVESGDAEWLECYCDKHRA